MPTGFSAVPPLGPATHRPAKVQVSAHGTTTGQNELPQRLQLVVHFVDPGLEARDLPIADPVHALPT